MITVLEALSIEECSVAEFSDWMQCWIFPCGLALADGVSQKAITFKQAELLETNHQLHHSEDHPYQYPYSLEIVTANGLMSAVKCDHR